MFTPLSVNHTLVSVLKESSDTAAESRVHQRSCLRLRDLTGRSCSTRSSTTSNPRTRSSPGKFPGIQIRQDFKFNGAKALDESFFLGTSPEFDISAFTACELGAADFVPFAEPL
ncbi:hypothetical protein AAVH_22484 [Aphelenchoides avenae]|nr:hypothetical protein AAVH_22484 [Aphelenchus avenae]